jgi:molybdopterin-guanine dinucleotide biosynthesis protein A
MPIYQNIGIIILAGGKSTRMGQDKGLMQLNQKAMVEHIIATCKKISDNIMLVANLDAYAQFGLPVYKDKYLECGPLSGIYTGLKKSNFDYNLVLSCDVPFIHEGVLEFLLDSCTGYDITISKSEGKIHPLVGVYRKTCLPVVKKNLDEKKLKVMGIFDELKVRELDMADFLPENFRNINSPDDL